jgi:hypothetical protein
MAPASMVILFGRGDVAAALIQWGKGRRPGGALIQLLTHGTLWCMAAYGEWWHTVWRPVERVVAAGHREEGGDPWYWAR